MSKKKIIIAVIASYALLSLLYYLFVMLPRQGNIAVDIHVHPVTADIYIDNKKSNSGTVYLQKGTHVFKAVEDGWKTDETTVTITDNLSTVALLPKPISQEAKDLAQEESAEREGLNGIAANVRGIEIRSKYPALNNLPYSDVSGPFKIDYGFNKDDNSIPFLIVSYSTPNGRQKALDWLISKNIDITMIEIIFEDFINPVHTEKHSE